MIYWIRVASAVAALALAAPFASAQFRLIPPSMSIDDIKSRVDEMEKSKDKIPENTYLIATEINRIEEQEGRALAALTILRRNEDNAARITQVEASTRALIQEIRGAHCESIDQAKAVDLWSRLRRIDGDMATLPGPQSGLGVPVPRDANQQPGTLCAALKVVSQQEGAILAVIQQVQAPLQQALAKTAADRDLVERYRKMLAERKAQLQEKLASPQDRLSTLLPYVIGVVGFFSVGALGMVWFFQERIQYEWVVSGQVIQYVTVMILLSVICALGMAGILKEQVLGTLLGGIAGYVLSQGVGRQVAREVTRHQEDKAASLAGSPATDKG